MSEEATLAADPMPGEEHSSTEIVERATVTTQAVELMPLMSDDEIRRTWRIANALARSRMFKDAVQAEQAFAKILIGRDLGISATQSLMAIDLVKGNIQLRGVLLASFVRKHPDYDYKVVEKTHKKSRVLFLGHPQDEQLDDDMVRTGGRWWEVLGEEEFTLEDAERAKLVKHDSAWTTHPKNMCFWRCISNGVKTHCPELLGGMPVYVEGELDSVPSGYTANPHSTDSAKTPEIPTELEELVARAHAVDPKAWRLNEVAARLPEPTADGFAAALEQITVELKQWLDENEPQDAVVVHDAPGNEGVDVAAELQHRWESDPEWRQKAEPVINSYADLEVALDTAVSDEDGAAAAEYREKLAAAQADLDALGIPAGWWPESAGAEA